MLWLVRFRAVQSSAVNGWVGVGIHLLHLHIVNNSVDPDEIGLARRPWMSFTGHKIALVAHPALPSHCRIVCCPWLPTLHDARILYIASYNLVTPVKSVVTWLSSVLSHSPWFCTKMHGVCRLIRCLFFPNFGV